MSQNQQIDLNQVYRTFQQSHATESQVIELFYNELVKLSNENAQLRGLAMKNAKVQAAPTTTKTKKK